MAKRSLMKRRSSRYSLRSAILDADTNNLGDEQTHWWKNLENNTVVQQSIGSNTLYQTSRHLNSNSEMETDDAEEGWWKVLDATVADPWTIGTNQTKRDRTQSAVSTSESGEEPRITKKKPLLRSGAKKGQASTFQNILNAHRLETEGSSSRPELGDTTDADSKQFQGNGRNSKADDILKLKPTVFKKNQRRNIFDDASEENESDISVRRKPSREITHGRFQRFLEKDIAGAAASPIIKRGPSPLCASFEHEGDISNIPLPEAQSTLLLQSTTSSTRDSNRDTDPSDIEIIQKPKPKLLKQQNKNAKKNVFEGILEEDASSTGVSEKSSLPPNALIKTSHATRNRNETKGSNAKAIRSKLIEHSDASSDTSSSAYTLLKPKTKLLKKFRTSPKRKNIFEDVLMDDDDLESLKKSGSMSTSARAENLAKQKRKNSSLEELTLCLSDSSRNNAAVAQTVSKSSKRIENSAKEGIPHQEDGPDVLKEDNRSSNRYAQTSPYVSHDSARATERVKGIENSSASRSRKQSMHSVVEDSRQKDSSKVVHRQSGKPSILSEMGEADKDVSTSRGHSRHSAKSQKQDSSTRTGVEANINENATARQSKSLRTSRRWLISSDTSESEAEEDRHTSRKGDRVSEKSQTQVSSATIAVDPGEIENGAKTGGNLSKLHKRSISGVADELEAAEIPIAAERQSGTSRKSERSVSPMKNAAVDLTRIDNEDKRLSRNLSKSRNRSTSGVAEELEAAEAQNTVERQSRISRKSERQVSPATSRIEHEGPLQKRSTLIDRSEPQAEDQNTSKRRSKVLEKSQKESEAKSESAQPQNSVRKQSEGRGSSSKGVKRSSLTVEESDVESVEIRISTARRSSNLSASQNKAPSQIASKLDMDLRASSERPVRRSSRLKRQSDLNSVNESKRKEDQSTLKRQSVTSNRSEKVSPMSGEAKSKTGNEEGQRSWQTILFHESESETDDQLIPRRPTNSSSKLKDRGIENEAEAEEDQSTLKKHSISRRQVSRTTNETGRVETGDSIKERSRGSSKSQKRSTVGVTEEPVQVENSSKRRSRASSKSLKQISSAVDGIEPEIEKPTNRGSRNSSTFRNQVPSDIAGELEMENEPTPKSQGKRSSRLVRQFALSSVNESKEKEDQATLKRQSGTLTEKRVSSMTDKAESNRILSPTEGQSNTSSKSQKSTSPDISESDSDLIARRQTKGPNKEKDQSGIGHQPEAKVDRNTLKKQSTSQRQSSPIADKSKVNEAPSTTKGQSGNLNISQPWLQFRDVSSDEESWSTPRRKVIKVPLKRSLNMSRRNVSLHKASSERSFSIALDKVPDSVHDSERQSERTSVSHRSILDYLMESESEEELILGKEDRIFSKSKDHSGVRDRSKTRGNETLKNKSTPEKQASVVANELEAAEPDTANRSPSRDTNKLQKRSLVRADKEIESYDAEHSLKQSRVSRLGEPSVNVSKKSAGKQRKISAYRRRSSRKLETATSSKLESIDAQQSRKESIASRLGGPAANETEELTGNQGKPAPEKQSSRMPATVTNELNSNDARHSGKGSTMSRLGEPVANETEEPTGRMTESLNRKRPEVNANTGRCIVESRSESELSASEAPKRFTFNPNVIDREDEASSGGSNDEAEDAAVLRSKELADEPNEAGGPTATSRTPVKYRTEVCKGQRNIMEFLTRGKLGSTSQDFTKEKMEEAMQKLEKIKEAEMDAMKASEEKAKSQLPPRGTKGKEPKRKTRSSTRRPPKPVNKAFMINGEVYKARMPRVKPWVTNRLYKHLCRCMESRYKIDNKAVCERFVQKLCEVTSYIEHEKQYSKYKGTLHALMKEMARLGIVHSRLDFYHFCQEFFPYELRSKLVPMWLPGNKRTIPFDPGTLNEPLIDTEE